MAADLRLPAGTTVMCSMGAANRDESVNANADTMDLSRTLWGS